MLTIDDRRYLENNAGTRGAAMQKVLAIGIVFLMAMGVANLWMAGWLARYCGDTYGSLLARYMEGIRPVDCYSGIYIKAIERLTVGAGEICLAGACAANWHAFSSERRRSRHIVEALKRGGVW